ncbi:MAG: DUF6516 family protein [Sulfurisoma sp.]|nr:DUF6516 family protein [Sulfurisoma sp.]
MQAELIVDFKDITPEGDIIQMRVWRLPQSMPPSEHNFEYSLYFGGNGQRIIAFDNERGKGDHCHIDGVERPYRFGSIEQLIEDFIVAVDKRRKT